MPTSTGQTRPQVTILCGFLGAGKTTLLQHLLSQADGRRWAAIVNDVASINIDGAVINASVGGGKVVELGNGCVCCSSKDELAESLAELAASNKYEHLLVETTGVAEPRALANLFVRRNPFGRSLSDFAVLASLVSVVDSFAFHTEWTKSRVAPRQTVLGADRPVLELMIEQVECADVIILNKSDRVPTSAQSELFSIMRSLNGRAEIVHSERGQVACEFLLGRVRFDAVETLKGAQWIQTLNAVAPIPAEAKGWVTAPRSKHVHEEKYGIRHFTYQARRPFRSEALEEVIRTRLPGLLRAKGFFWSLERPDEMGFLSVAGGAVRYDFLSYWWAAMIESGKARMEERPPAIRAAWSEPSGDRRQELVFIGIGLDEAAARVALDGCLA